VSTCGAMKIIKLSKKQKIVKRFKSKRWQNLDFLKHIQILVYLYTASAGSCFGLSVVFIETKPYR